MPLGFYPLGFGPLGAVPPSTPAVPVRATYPRSLWFDGATRDYTIGADGRYLDLHPVDQRVALALLVALGSITLAPALGSTITSVAPGAPTTLAAATAAVRRALRDLLAEPAIVLRSVVVETSAHGRLEAAVTYVNLARAATDPARLQTARAAL